MTKIIIKFRYKSSSNIWDETFIDYHRPWDNRRWINLTAYGQFIEWEDIFVKPGFVELLSRRCIE